ncbi:MAG: ABC transporter ATP-binding protein/permease [Prosthecobacter sp.]|uniref:ABC transporter ATP-binding protein/permease n=1 Tax=Prosthecobacter sp. TaxID=1965333 RepID=UPI0038FD8DA7
MSKTPRTPLSLIAKEKLSKTARQLWQITRAFFKSERRVKARGLLTLLLTLSVASVGVIVLTSYAGRDLITAIENKNAHAYWSAMGRYLATFVVAVLIDVCYRWAEQSLALLWREWMSQHLIKRYFNNRAYYRLRGSESIDNPDQRISEDVRNFTIDSLSYALLVVNSVMTLIGFLGVLWSISGTLVGVALVYAAGGTFMCFVIGRRLVGLHYDKYQKEADFRYGLVRVRDNAESITFYRGEKREHLDLVNRLAAVVANMRTIIRWNRNLGFFRNSYNSIALVVPILIVAPMFMRGELQFGVVTQTLGAFAQVLGAVSLIADNFEGLSAYLAGVQRLGILWDDLDDFDADEERIARENHQQLDATSTQVKLDLLTVHTPDGSKLLAKDLSFELHPHQSLMIMGASGTGKSSILRTIAGLWPGGPGSLERPALNHLMFLPQRPYMVPGSLRDQLRYPDHEHGTDDEAIRQVVEKVNLADVLARVDGNLDRVIDWTNVLSLGEQQRVAFARLFLRNPRFVFLDEATSALDEDNQNRLYELIRESGIGFISVGHRETLRRFHERVLQLKGVGEWELMGTATVKT